MPKPTENNGGGAASRHDPVLVDPNVDTRVEAFARGAELGPMAAALRAGRQDILLRWLAAARQQPFHAAHPNRAVADHIPHLLDALVDFLERSAPARHDPIPPLDDPRIAEAARAHAADRFAQGLTPADVLAEFRLLRQEIGRALREGTDGAGDLLAAELLVHDALDGATGLGLAALEAYDAEPRRLRGELAAIVESSDDAILSVTLDGIVTNWNPAPSDRGATRGHDHGTERGGGRLDLHRLPANDPGVMLACGRCAATENVT